MVPTWHLGSLSLMDYGIELNLESGKTLKRKKHAAFG